MIALPKIIGITGPMASGKDTLAKELKKQFEDLGFKVTLLAFADSLKDELDVYLNNPNLIEHSNTNPNNQEKLRNLINQIKAIDPFFTSRNRHPLIRELLQFWGTDVRRSEDSNYWIKQTEKVIQNTDGIIILTDARFENELEAVKKHHGYLIRLTIDPQVQKQRLMQRDGIKADTKALTHASETNNQNIPADYTLEQTEVEFNKESFDDQIKKLMDNLKSEV